jgi:UDP-N-acetylmuramoylalanine--D-glutamate ligase
MKKISILGAGESGVGAALLAKAKGMEVFVSDMSQIKPAYRQQLEQQGISFEEGRHTLVKIFSADEIIKSPGIPDKAEVVWLAKEKGIPVISEIEFAGRYTRAKCICITGTNGKTTSSLLTYHLLRSGGLNVGLAGNIGESLAAKVIEDRHDFYVLELSSFQLDNMYRFQAYVGILLNITPDHLDRYEYNMSLYAQSKLRLTQNMTPENYFIYNAEDPVIQKHLRRDQLVATTVAFGLERGEQVQAFYAGSDIVVQLPGRQERVDTSQSVLIGKHNQYNTLASVAAAVIAGVSSDAIAEALGTFKNAAHRLQKVGELEGVIFINDSKATNVEAVWYALEGIKQPIVWIAGGVDKGNDYTALDHLVREKVKALVCLGKDNEKLKKAFGDQLSVIEEAGSAEEAVIKARELAQAGDVVLLSPACASFDLFNNYEHRGQSFAEAVTRLIKEQKA